MSLPSVWKLFLLHGSLSEVQVLSLFFCLCFFFFLLPYPGAWAVSCLLGSLRSSASVQSVFCRSCSTCRCTFDVPVGRKVISTSYSSAILKVPCMPFLANWIKIGDMEQPFIAVIHSKFICRTWTQTCWHHLWYILHCSIVSSNLVRFWVRRAHELVGKTMWKQFLVLNGLIF